LPGRFWFVLERRPEVDFSNPSRSTYTLSFAVVVASKVVSGVVLVLCLQELHKEKQGILALMVLRLVFRRCKLLVKQRAYGLDT
jgi:hypothetical protein